MMMVSTGRPSKGWGMKYRITRHDGEEDDITSQGFDDYDDAYDLLEEIYGDMCCSDADYEDRPYYEIIESKKWWNFLPLLSSLPIHFK